jgi:hypothetical protein
MATRRFRRAEWMTLGVLAGLAIGCGAAPSDEPQRVSVKGTVTLDGKPLEQGVIRFVPLPEVKGPKASVDVTDGRFEIPADVGPVAGKHRVEIESTDHGGIEPDDETALAELAAGKRKPVKPVKIPAIYNARSTLQKEVKSDSPNEFKFDLVTRR